MKVSVNGQEMTLEEPCNVRHLLERCAPTSAACAVEVNRQIVPRRNHAERMLADGDSVEIVTLVGGG